MLMMITLGMMMVIMMNVKIAVMIIPIMMIRLVDTYDDDHNEKDDTFPYDDENRRGEKEKLRARTAVGACGSSRRRRITRLMTVIIIFIIVVIVIIVIIVIIVVIVIIIMTVNRFKMIKPRCCLGLNIMLLLLLFLSWVSCCNNFKGFFKPLNCKKNVSSPCRCAFFKF